MPLRLYSNIKFVSISLPCVFLERRSGVLSFLFPLIFSFFNRFINREGIDFSDAQDMQAIQVCLMLAHQCIFNKFFISTYLTYLYHLFQGMGFGWEFARSVRIPNKVISNYYSVSLTCSRVFVCKHFIPILSWRAIEATRHNLLNLSASHLLIIYHCLVDIVLLYFWTNVFFSSFHQL